MHLSDFDAGHGLGTSGMTTIRERKKYLNLTSVALLISQDVETLFTQAEKSIIEVNNNNSLVRIYLVTVE